MYLYLFTFTNQVLIVNDDVLINTTPNLVLFINDDVQINTTPNYILFINDDVLINTQGTDAAKFVKSAAQLKAKEAKVRG